MGDAKARAGRFWSSRWDPAVSGCTRAPPPSNTSSTGLGSAYRVTRATKGSGRRGARPKRGVRCGWGVRQAGERSERRRWGARWRGSEERASDAGSEDAVGECRSRERSETRRSNENKRMNKEYKKGKVVVHVTPHQEGVAGIGRPVCSITIRNTHPIPKRENVI
jgi:hypothetical protein